MSKLAGVSALAILIAGSAEAQQIQDVFYIALENHNFTQPSGVASPQQLLGNPAAPYLNSLVTPGNPNAAQTSFARNYQNVFSAGVPVHPSEPNYVWQEAGVASNSPTGPWNDADPYPSNIVNAPNLSALLAARGTSWRSYQEDIDLATNASGHLTNTPLPQSQWTVPTTSLSGTSPAYLNAYNGSDQYNYAAKHNPQVFFTATNGGTATTPDTTPANPQARNYAPLQQLATDLANNTEARYTWITPDQYNDMHSYLTNGFTYHGVHYTGDQAAIAEGDNFLSIVVPEIMASAAYKNDGEIVIWNDETEGGDGPGYTSTEIVISPLARGNAYSNDVRYDHSSDLVTLEALFGVGASLGYSAGATPLTDLYKAGAIPTPVPEPATWAMLALGFACLGYAAAGRARRSAPR